MDESAAATLAESARVKKKDEKTHSEPLRRKNDFSAVSVSAGS